MLAASRGQALLAQPRAQQPLSLAPLRRSAPVRTSVSVAVKPTKAADFQGLSDDEIFAKISDLKKELATVRFLFRTRGISEMAPGDSSPQPDPEKMPKPHVNKHLRRQVAQLWTVWRQRQIKAGVDARTSRKQLNAQIRSGMGL
ncbi:hypothetical protein DUNSADRAFT_3964 [Dunaliella salina]|uniref:Uncharacterized protein n=1 Tax=Dunaliella salina TaxID=3046 RepID=A0ABQ7H7V5_DUNSA|nr:hypothetical protein DUNSADRAFT_3964 [Dunaliella salina]|eukprot:KAF5842937.1 hypothetical protein DUNSADRAFT_3964 [Dunaliella salina]